MWTFAPWLHFFCFKRVAEMPTFTHNSLECLTKFSGILSDKSLKHLEWIKIGHNFIEQLLSKKKKKTKYGNIKLTRLRLPGEIPLNKYRYASWYPACLCLAKKMFSIMFCLGSSIKLGPGFYGHEQKTNLVQTVNSSTFHHWLLPEVNWHSLRCLVTCLVPWAGWLPWEWFRVTNVVPW